MMEAKVRLRLCSKLTLQSMQVNAPYGTTWMAHQQCLKPDVRQSKCILICTSAYIIASHFMLWQWWHRDEFDEPPTAVKLQRSLLEISILCCVDYGQGGLVIIARPGYSGRNYQQGYYDNKRFYHWRIGGVANTKTWMRRFVFMARIHRISTLMLIPDKHIHTLLLVLGVCSQQLATSSEVAK